MSCTLSYIEPENAVPILSEQGMYVDEAFKYIDQNTAGVDIIDYVIMPNHVHFIATVNGADVRDIVKRIKTYSAKKSGKSLWQRSFHDHKIRGDVDGEEIRKYVRNNPLKWVYDKYYDQNA